MPALWRGGCGRGPTWPPSGPTDRSPTSYPIVMPSVAKRDRWCLFSNPLFAPLCSPFPGIKCSDPFDLCIFQFDWRRAAEDRNCNLDPGTALIDILDGPVEGRERAVGDTHRLANFKRDRRLGPFDALGDLPFDAFRFAIGNRHRLLVRA